MSTQLPFLLVACEEFKAGDLGYASAAGVMRPERDCPTDFGRCVRALTDVGAWQEGEFELASDGTGPGHAPCVAPKMLDS